MSVFRAELALELLPESFGQRRTGAPRRYRNLEVAALHDGRVVKITELRDIDNVAQNAKFPGLPENRAVNPAGRRRRDNKKNSRQVRVSELALFPTKASTPMPSGDLRRHLGRHEPDLRAG